MLGPWEGAWPLTAGVGTATNVSFSCESENPLRISCDCQKQVLNVGFFFLKCIIFFLNIYLAAPGLRCGTGVLSGGMPAPSCDTWGTVPQPGPCIASVASQSLGYGKFHVGLP